MSATTHTRLEAAPTRWFSWDYEISAEGRPLTCVSLSTWRERGRFALDGAEYEITREGLVGAFHLVRDGVQVASATKPSAFFRSLGVEFGSSNCVLRAAGPFSRRFLLERDGAPMGTISPKGAFSRHAAVDLADVPVDVAVFMAWLVIVLWRRAYRSS